MRGDEQRGIKDKESSRGKRLGKVDQIEKEQSVRISNCQFKCSPELIVASWSGFSRKGLLQSV